MIPTPEQVIPLVEGTFEPLREALRGGLAYAEKLQPDENVRDPWFWSDSARFDARKRLRRCDDLVDWLLPPRAPNSSIKLIRRGGYHTMRVLRSFGGMTPHPGSTRARQLAWTFTGHQFVLPVADGLPPLDLIADWQDDDGEPLMHLGLPAEPWHFRQRPRLHWRVPVPGAGESWTSLSFPGGGDSGDDLVTLKLDPAELRGSVS